MKKLLIIGLVWPEPTSSAAGTRMLQLINLFIKENYTIIFACAAAKTEFSYLLTSLGVEEVKIELNNSNFNLFVSNLSPDIVLFDRYMVEEQYSWRVNEASPNSLKILDTEDLHFLRYARQNSFKVGKEFDNSMLYTDNAKREIASILRCDIFLIISKKEIDILINQFNINPSIIYYLPFLEKGINTNHIEKWKTFEERKNFVFIGNFIHEPNWDCVKELKKTIWPKIRLKLPNAELHIYGAYATHKHLQLTNKWDGFIVKGRTADAKNTIENYKVLLAPLNFGAGLKGKFIDAMYTGTPIVTTSIGVEAMDIENYWNGYITDNEDDFIIKSEILYTNKDIWTEKQKQSIYLLNNIFKSTIYEKNFINYLTNTYTNLFSHRQKNFYGQILQYQLNQGTKYMSLWIEEKNKKN